MRVYSRYLAFAALVVVLSLVAFGVYRVMVPDRAPVAAGGVATNSLHSSGLSLEPTATSAPVCQYNAAGQLTRITYSDGTFYARVYDAHGNKVSEVQPDGKTWTYIYDQHQHVSATIGPDGKVVR